MPFLTADCLAFHYDQSHCLKSGRIQSYSGPYFSRIQTEYGPE